MLSSVGQFDDGQVQRVKPRRQNREPGSLADRDVTARRYNHFCPPEIKLCDMRPLHVFSFKTRSYLTMVTSEEADERRGAPK